MASKRRAMCTFAFGNQEALDDVEYAAAFLDIAPMECRPRSVQPFGARRKYLSMSFGFAVPGHSRGKRARNPTFSATAAAMN